jgi:hypothetical protein
MKPFSEADLRRIVKEGCTEALTTAGIDTANPKEAQADMLHLRRHRKGCDIVKRHTLTTIVGTAVVGFIYTIVESFKR